MKSKINTAVYLKTDDFVYYCGCSADFDEPKGLLEHIKKDHPDHRPPTVKQIAAARGKLIHKNGVRIGRSCADFRRP